MAVYDSEECARTFHEDLALHLMHGFVFSTPEVFVMGRAVSSQAHEDLIVDASYCFESWQCDCWHVYLLAGSMVNAWRLMPYPLPMFSLERKNELRFYKFADIARHV